MTVQLRPYQQELESRIHTAWASGARNVLAVAPTGAGKTVLMSKILHDHSGASVAIAHRQELVGQISLALARNGVRHRVIAAEATRRSIVAGHMEELGRSYYDANSRTAVAGVDTLIRMPDSDPWFQQVTMWVTDECHHLLRENKWGKGVALFPHAKGLGVSATPRRADGKGLGRDSDGLIDVMVESIGMRDLIDAGYLTDYRIFAPPSNFDRSKVEVSETTGDFSAPKLREAVHKSMITGDIVSHYLRIARGKLGVTFAVDIETATEIAQAFNAAGVPAAVVTSKTQDAVRRNTLRQFKNRQLLQLVNVDLFGEGFDLPAIEVVSMGRPTESFALYSQQFGRSLRLLEGKERAIIIDHVGNVLRHGLPDAPQQWTLDRRERRSKPADDAIPVRICVNLNANNTGTVCAKSYPRLLRCCPHCGYYPEPAQRGAPEFVDGDLEEMDAELLAKLRGEIARVDNLAPLIPHGVAPEVAGAIKKRHWERQQAQATLRQSMSVYGGYTDALGDPSSAAHRRFYLTFGIDVLSAQALGAREAGELAEKINAVLNKNQVIAIDGTVN